MLKRDMCDKLRFYVKGSEEDAKRFTIDLMWYHSALATIGSINRTRDDKIILNLIVHDDADEADEIRLRNMAEKFNLIGFSDFNELR